MTKKKTTWKKGRKRRKPKPKADSQAKVAPSRSAGSSDDEFLAGLAEGVWRLKRRVEGDASRDWAEPIIDGLSHDLQSLGVEIIDRTGTPYTRGDTTEVVHSDAPPDWQGKLTVTEVVRPTIRVSGKVVRHGQVVLGEDNG